MADPTTTKPAGVETQNGKGTDPAVSSPELAPVIKGTRAKSTATPATKATTAKASGVEGATKSASLPVSSRPANVEIYQGGADTVSGDAVSITQGGASMVTAKTIEIHQGGIGRAQADDINVRMGGVGLARADRVSVEMGGIGLSLARESHVTQGVARTVLAQDVRVDQGLVGTAFAGKVTFEQPSGVFLLVAGKTEGPVKALLDWRGALAFGAIFGLLVGLLRRR